MPLTIGRCSASRARRFDRSSSLTERLDQPAARSSPSVWGRVTGSDGEAVTGAERTTGPPGRQTTGSAARSEAGQVVARTPVRSRVGGANLRDRDRQPAQPDLRITDAGEASSQRHVREDLDQSFATRPLEDEPGLLVSEADPDRTAAGGFGGGGKEPAQTAGGEGGRWGPALEGGEPDATADRVFVGRPRGALIGRPLGRGEVMLDQERERGA